MKENKLVIIIIQFHKFTKKFPENWTFFKQFLMDRGRLIERRKIERQKIECRKIERRIIDTLFTDTPVHRHLLHRQPVR
jgi:hypothetical protein